MGDTNNVDTASGDIGGNQAAYAAIFESAQRAVTSRLFHVAMQSSGLNTKVGEFNRQFFRIATSRSEHN